MPLPQLDNFESLLGSITADEPADKGPWREVVAVPRKVVKDGGNFRELATVGFWYLESEELSLESFVRRVALELKHLGHPDSPEIVAVILGVYARVRRSKRSGVEQLNLLFKNIVTTDLNQYVAFSAYSQEAYRFKVDNFTIGNFNLERLVYQSRKAGSDFFDRYEKDLRQLPFSVERAHFPVKTVHWNRLASSQQGWATRTSGYVEVVTQLRDHYYQLLSATHFEDFRAQLRLAQEVGMAFGSGWFDPDALARLLGAQFISVYLDVGGDKWGYVSFSGIGFLGFNLGGAHLGMPATKNSLREHFGFEGFEKYEIHQTIKTFCHFLALAESHHAERRHAEGFLHHVIALDLLLGEKSASTQNISKRSSVLSHRARGKGFNDGVTESEAIYDARSRYVHAGKEPDARLWDVARSICREVAFCLFRLQAEPANQSDGFHDRWMRDVDLVAATLVAGRKVPDADLRGIGISLEKDFTLAEFQAILHGANRLRQLWEKNDENIQ